MQKMRIPFTFKLNMTILEDKMSNYYRLSEGRSHRVLLELLPVTNSDKEGMLNIGLATPHLKKEPF